MGRPSASGLLLLLGALLPLAARADEPCHFDRDFAPSEGIVRPEEQPFREAVCLNGLWQFQPLPIPGGFTPNRGFPPELAPPKAEGWEATPIKVPSPWNVNTWGCGRNVGAGTAHPYWPSSLYYPSYPESWDSAKMGWLRRTFRLPEHWKNRRMMLNFEAVAGECQIFVNGQKAGQHFDKYLPFTLDITTLVRHGADNELLVGVRDARLFNNASSRYPKMLAPYPCGSNTDSLVGIWQDVFLLGLSPVRITDVFVKPILDRDTLEVEITLRNDSRQTQTLVLEGTIRPWINLAGESLLDAPEPKWKLGPAAMTVAPQTVELPPDGHTVVRLRESVGTRLKTWTPDSPNLYTAVLQLSKQGKQVDCHSTRFGWRQLKIDGKDLLLNGEKIQLVGDLAHPFGPLSMSRRFVWAWYKMIKDFGGNAVRPHAQVHPRIYLDLADEMGLMVLDETALFGSSVQLNFADPQAWPRFEEHYDGMVLRDRNHPSVFGWSVGNELFAIFNLNGVVKGDADRWYDKLAELALRARRLDPTRDWISCDGDDDLRGKLPVWSKHFGLGVPLDRLPTLDKPLMVGESGGSYYARPKELSPFNGPRAYESYRGRNEALAIDLYENLTQMARPRLTYFSASETVWFGLEHLPLGYRNHRRVPNQRDGVVFSRPYEEGKAGMQPERLPPYVTTLNPGWDAELPLYKALPMFEAEKAALAKESPRPCPWKRVTAAAAATTSPAPSPVERAPQEQVCFCGEQTGRLARRLVALGVPLTFESPVHPSSALVIVDGDGLTEANLGQAERCLQDLRDRGGTGLLMLAGDREALTNRLLPATIRLTERPATALAARGPHPWVASYTAPQLYFAEDGADRLILAHGLEGPLVDQGRVLLAASGSDWSLFNDTSESAKCAAAVLYEQLEKPNGACLVAYPYGKATLAVSTVDYRIVSPATDRFWRQLFSNMGVRLKEPSQSMRAALDESGVLIHALSIGRFDAATSEAALLKDFIGEKTVRPRPGDAVGQRVWRAAHNPSNDRFLLDQLQPRGSQEKASGTYLSFWIRSPRALDDLLNGGPDVPRVTAICYAYEKCRLWLQGTEVSPARTEPADYRTLSRFENLPLRKGWNHLLVKIAVGPSDPEKPGTCALRIETDPATYLRQLESAREVESMEIGHDVR